MRGAKLNAPLGLNNMRNPGWLLFEKGEDVAFAAKNSNALNAFNTIPKVEDRFHNHQCDEGGTQYLYRQHFSFLKRWVRKEEMTSTLVRVVLYIHTQQ